ncbi:MAG: helix-turn-helix domain-containing protein [Methylobacteriaceae bacterium]|nr:helix-turn-helix domain-containing protein [Methylobacteriaceae bacterium]
MTTLSSAAAVLRCYSADRCDLTVTQVSGLLGMPKSNASRLLRAMAACGLLEPVGASKRYRPGLLLHEAGAVFRTSSALTQRADEVVARVAAASGHTGYVSRRDGVEMVAVTDHPGMHALRVASSIGRRLNAGASATGRSLLARLPDAEIRALFTPFPTPPSANAPSNADELLRRVEAVRRRGFACAIDEANRGVGAVAVAVGDPQTQSEVSLCITFPAALMNEAERIELARELHEGAAAIAALTGDARFPAAFRAEAGAA